MAAGVLLGSTDVGVATAVTRERRPPPSRSRHLLVRGGTVVTQDRKIGTFGRGDVLIEDNKIVQVAPYISAPRHVEIIDASGAVVLPGFVDNHRHLAVTIEDDQGADLYATHGRYRYFAPEEVEPL